MWPISFFVFSSHGDVEDSERDVLVFVFSGRLSFLLRLFVRSVKVDTVGFLDSRSGNEATNSGKMHMALDLVFYISHNGKRNVSCHVSRVR